MRSEARVCPSCGSAVSPEARFCSLCGRPLEEATASETETETETLRHVYGVLSPTAALGLVGVLLVAGVLALIAGSVIGALGFLASAAVAFVFFLDAAKRDASSPVARRVATSAGSLRGWARVGRESGSAWSRAARDVLRLRSESRTLRREREHAIRSLGDAAYREDEPAVTALRERVREIDESLAERERAKAESLARARQHVEEERAAARPTEQYSVDELTSGEKPDE